jgi:hypothetical protein
MRSDFVLPIVLAVALAVMALYATSHDERDGARLVTTPIECTNGSLITALRELPEASGLAASRRDKNLFWAHNDSAEPIVFGVSADGAIRARVRVTGASVTDWEAVTTAACGSGNCLFIGDIGDNDRARRSVTVYRTAEPASADNATEQATAIRAVYPEGAQDAEALFAYGESLFIVSKGERTPIRVYRFPALTAETSHTLQLVTTLTPEGADEDFRVTDAAISPDNRWIVLRSNDLLLFYDAKRLLAGSPGTPLSFDLRPLKEPQGEGVAWADNRTLFLAGEGRSGGTFARLTCPALAD